MKLTFLGAAQTVTGSKYLLEDEDRKYLVDCGLFQGLKELRLRNWMPLPVDAKAIDALFLTHAHLDHSGYIPLLVKQGFKGPIYSSYATKELSKIILLDSGRLQEEEAKNANRKGYSKHRPALPLYTEEDAEHALSYFHPVDFDKDYALKDEAIAFKLTHSGHILGSSFITLKHKGLSIVFSGDLGRGDDPLMRPPEKIEYADYLIMESTYGNRLHPKVDALNEFEKIINATIARGGTVVIPAFAVGRTQTVLYYITQLKEENRIPPTVPVYIDSPMGQEATDVFCNHLEEHRISSDQSKNVCSIALYAKTRDESKQLDSLPNPAIIISSSGMAEGGRVLYHIEHFGPDPKNTILFTGYQAEGTRGANLINGEREVKIHGMHVPIKAQVKNLEALSSHADYDGIVEWMKSLKSAPKEVFLTHGEPEGSFALKAKIESELKWKVTVPYYMESFDL